MYTHAAGRASSCEIDFFIYICFFSGDGKEEEGD